MRNLNLYHIICNPISWAQLQEISTGGWCLLYNSKFPDRYLDLPIMYCRIWLWYCKLLITYYKPPFRNSKFSKQFCRIWLFNIGMSFCKYRIEFYKRRLPFYNYRIVIYNRRLSIYNYKMAFLKLSCHPFFKFVLSVCGIFSEKNHFF